MVIILTYGAVTRRYYKEVRNNKGDSMPHDDQDITIHTYQDDFDTADDKTDPIMDEETDDPLEMFGVPAAEFKSELDKRELNDADTDNDDQREEIEDLDEDSRRY
jgi:hypothetical protein